VRSRCPWTSQPDSTSRCRVLTSSSSAPVASSRRRGQQCPYLQVRLGPLPAVHRPGHGLAHDRRRRSRVRRLPARPRAHDPRPSPPGGHHGGARRGGRPGHLLRGALRARDRGGPEGRRCGAERRDGALHQLGQRAAGTAVRLARAVTGRRLLVRFEGHYHGWQDVVYWSNHVDPDEPGRPTIRAGGLGRVPQELADTLVILSWNDPDSFQRVMDERGDEIAAVITEPAMFNTGCILPRPATSSCCAPRLAARRRAHLRRGHHRLSLQPRRRSGVVRRDADLTTWPRARRRLSGSRHRRQPGGHGHDRRRPLLALRHLQRQRRAVRRGCRQPWTCSPSRALRAPAGARRAARPGPARPGRPVRHPRTGRGLGTVFQIWFSERPIHDWRRRAPTPTKPASRAGGRRCCCAA